jgi:transcription elongation GreA/GreB family factor
MAVPQSGRSRAIAAGRGEDEADPAKGSISHVSPLARAMLGKALGDVITAGKDEAEIKSIV